MTLRDPVPAAHYADAPDLAALRTRVRDHVRTPEDALVRALIAEADLSADARQRIEDEAAGFVTKLREDSDAGLMEVFLAEYGLSTDEGLALMCLAEALLRVPDAETVDALIEDKIAPGAWLSHFGQSASALVNASTLGLALTGRVLGESEAGGLLGGAMRRLGEPVIRAAVTRAMREMGRQFVLGQTIEEAAKRAARLEAEGFTHSYDMLGEAAMTRSDADAFLASYAHAIEVLAARARSSDIAENPGISIKLSALHPRYEESQRARVMDELVPRVVMLARAAKDARIGLNVDAEEAARLDLSLDVVAAALAEPDLADWDGFGVVVQAYGKRASFVIDWLHELALSLDRRIMVRLVKGAYWDAEIKRAQVEGLPGFPVFTRKAATDVSYIACAGKLLGMTDRIYPQFATHNAHTIAAILDMSKGRADAFEFQRLHGMGEALHAHVARTHGARCRIYAPVGRHRELLAYLVRRLLENGANSSFVNQVVDPNVPAREVVADPFVAALEPARAIAAPADIFAPQRNSRGWDLADPRDLAAIEAAREPFREHTWTAGPLTVGTGEAGEVVAVLNPADPSDRVGMLHQATADDAGAALAAAVPWSAPIAQRAATLRTASDLYEARFGEFFALLAREAGKTLPDAVAELREAVDFLRYYAAEAERLGEMPPHGVFVCISPWNFPLAIFTGQVAAALAAGNAVVAKPAEETPFVAHLATRLLHEAGVPREALQLLPGPGETVGAALTADARIGGVCFTGSTDTAQAINRAMAASADPHAPLIAETGGLNAMIVDSTALPEQAVRDVVASAFQSAGQRCSALRILYVQEDICEPLLRMLFGAMDELRLGDPWALDTDVGPVITADAKEAFEAYVAEADAKGRLLKRLPSPGPGHMFGPAVIRVEGIEDLAAEVFGPLLHVATFPAEGVDAVVDAINARGYGLTFGLHTRITARAERVTDRIRAGNAYVNRNQIGAVVGSQPFGGEGLSGTGPKAGGPHYVPRFAAAETVAHAAVEGPPVIPREVAARLATLARSDRARLETRVLPGPTGEANVLSTYPRGPVLCLGPGWQDAEAQMRQARAVGCPTIGIAPGLGGTDTFDGTLAPDALEALPDLAAVAYWGGPETARRYRQTLARRPGPIVPLLAARALAAACILERHVCTDTTAAGGNAQLIATAA